MFQLGVVVHECHLSTGRQGQEDCRIKSIPGCIGDPRKNGGVEEKGWGAEEERERGTERKARKGKEREGRHTWPFFQPLFCGAVRVKSWSSIIDISPHPSDLGFHFPPFQLGYLLIFQKDMTGSHRAQNWGHCTRALWDLLRSAMLWLCTLGGVLVSLFADMQQNRCPELSSFFSFMPFEVLAAHLIKNRLCISAQSSCFI